jgi:predicted nucleic acid-binding protein
VHEAICDTSPIQYLHQTGFLHLLAEFYTRIIIPPAVVDELERGRSIGVDLPDVRALPWLTIQAPEELDKVLAAADLGAGEKEVLALGTELPAAVLILDERLGRLHAEALKLTFTGTIGILLRAKVEGRIPRIDHLLEHLDLLGFRLSARTRAAILKLAGE